VRRHPVAGRTVVVGAGQQALVGHAGQRELHVRHGGVQQHGKPGAAIGVDRPVGQGLILQVQQFRAGPHQPVVAPAQPDQVLVQAVDRPAVGRQVPGTVREGGPDLGVAVSALVLDAAEGLLVAHVDARRARHGQQDHQGVGEVARVRQLAGQPGDIVVADERQRPERRREAVVPVQRPGQLEESCRRSGSSRWPSTARTGSRCPGRPGGSPRRNRRGSARRRTTPAGDRGAPGR